MTFKLFSLLKSFFYCRVIYGKTFYPFSCTIFGWISWNKSTHFRSLAKLILSGESTKYWCHYSKTIDAMRHWHPLSSLFKIISKNNQPVIVKVDKLRQWSKSQPIDFLAFEQNNCYCEAIFGWVKSQLLLGSHSIFK